TTRLRLASSVTPEASHPFWMAASAFDALTTPRYSALFPPMMMMRQVVSAGLATGSHQVDIVDPARPPLVAGLRASDGELVSQIRQSDVGPMLVEEPVYMISAAARAMPAGKPHHERRIVGQGQRVVGH